VITSRHIIAIGFALLTALGGCAGPTSPAYAVAYRQALDELPGFAPVDPAWLDRFVSHFSSRGDQPMEVDSGALYAKDLYFCDTLLTTRSREELQAHMEAFTDSGARVAIEVLDRQIDGPDAYLIWFMKASFSPAGREVTSQTLGVSHLRFNEDAEVIFQQDYWDPTDVLYRRIPIANRLIGYVRKRL